MTISFKPRLRRTFILGMKRKQNALKTAQAAANAAALKVSRLTLELEAAQHAYRTAHTRVQEILELQAELENERNRAPTEAEIYAGRVFGLVR